MTLSIDQPYNRHTHAPGVFISQVSVVNVENISGQQPPYMERPIDLGLKLTLNIGRDFQPDLIIAGNFKRDAQSNDVIGWGSAFVVQDILSRLGYSGILQEGNVLPQEALDFLLHKSFYRLSYVSGVKDNGRLRYTDWNQVATLDEGAESLVNRFKKSLCKGYPKNYHPEFMDEPAPATAPTAAADVDPF